MIAPRHRLIYALLAVALATSLYGLALRHADEQNHRRVELVVDVNDAQTLAEASDLELEEALNRFVHEGRATAAALTEQTLKDLRDQGRLQVYVRGIQDAYEDEQGKLLPARYGILITAVDTILYQRILTMAKARGVARELKLDAGRAIALAAAPSALDDFGVGFDERQLDAVRKAKLTIVARVRNYASLRRAAVGPTIEQLAGLGAKLVIFSEEEVFGYRDLIPFTANELVKWRLLFGSVEFSKQRGDEGLSLRTQGNLLRVHSITDKELPLFTPSEAVARYVRAVEERNIRVCYLRLFRHIKHEAIDESIRYVRRLHDELAASGYQFGGAKPTALTLRARLLNVAGVGVVAATVLLIDWFVPLGLLAQAGLLALGSCVSTGLFFWSKQAVASDMKGVALVALVAGLVFPCLAMVMSDLPRLMNVTDSDREAWKLRALQTLGLASAWSAAGGLLIGTVLADWKFMTQTTQFLGVKATQFVPLLFALLVFVGAAAVRGGESSPVRWERVRRQLSALLAQPLRGGVALLGVIALLALAFWLVRTGNQPGLGVSEWELKFRSVLEQALIARPRTKEFLVGHPMLIIAVWLAARGRRELAVWCAAFATIGQVGMLNSFCHLHTPIAVAVLRSINGLWIGALVGFGAVVVAERLCLERSSEAGARE